MITEIDYTALEEGTRRVRPGQDQWAMRQRLVLDARKRALRVEEDLPGGAWEQLGHWDLDLGGIPGNLTQEAGEILARDLSRMDRALLTVCCARLGTTLDDEEVTVYEEQSALADVSRCLDHALNEEGYLPSVFSSDEWFEDGPSELLMTRGETLGEVVANERAEAAPLGEIDDLEETVAQYFASPGGAEQDLADEEGPAGRLLADDRERILRVVQEARGGG